ncbi:hypothetical protein AAF712_007291 [Marasmius tenuissimus]|uniref:Uncharacterized protein n=1 Tax=Marasmius tenuissimus TaxID=585030 RepID=A0ABR2ZWE7_9AGAR
MDGDYFGQVAEIEFGDACHTYKTGFKGEEIKRFQLEETEEYKWLMSEVASEEFTEDEDDLRALLDVFPQPPSFAANKKMDKKAKRHGVIFDFPKVQAGVDCGKWW